MTIKINKITLSEKHRSALLAASNGALTKEAVETLANTVEALMNSKIKEVAGSISKVASEKYKAVAKKALKIHAEKRDAQLKKYVNYVVKEWVAKNSKPIQQTIENRRNSAIVESLVKTMGEVYMKVPGTSAEKVVSQLTAKAESLQKQVVAGSTAVKSAQIQNEKLKKLVVIERLGRDLTVSQREKFIKMAMEAKAPNLKSFAETAKTLKKSILNGGSTKTESVKKPVAGGKVVAESAVSRAARI